MFTFCSLLVREARLQRNFRQALAAFEQARPRTLYVPFENKTMHWQTDGLLKQVP